MTITPMSTDLLPDNFEYGFVADRIMRVVGDTTRDTDRFPDGVPAKGVVKFTPDKSLIVSVDPPGQYTPEPIECTIHQGSDQPDDPDPDKAGLLIDPAGHVGNVALVVGHYVATYHLESGVRMSAIPFEVTVDHTEQTPLWLPLVRGLQPSPSTKFVVNEQVYTETLAARDEAVQARDETEAPIIDLGAVAGTVTLGGDGPRFYTATLTGDLTATLPAPVVAGRAFTVSLLLTQDTTGGHSLTIPGAQTAWSVPIVPTEDPGATTLVHLLWTGTGWLALAGAPNTGTPEGWEAP